MSDSFAGLPLAEPESLGLDPAALDRFAAVLNREIAAGRAPGAALAIGRRGRIGFVQAFGAIRPGGPAMPLDALFRIYSMTKPMVSIAAMALVEEGRLFLTDPVSTHLPAFAATGSSRPMTVHDLLRHTSGLCYGFTGASDVQQQVHAGRFVDSRRDPDEALAALAALPLMHAPGTAWEYGLSTDVLGRIVETIEGRPLDEVLRARLFEPLGLTDTDFHTPPEKVSRRAEPNGFAMLDAAGIDRMSHAAPPRWRMGGTGAISTLADYVRFCAMLSAGGALEGRRILGDRTLRLMASNHLEPGMAIQDTPLLPPGHGFGLGFAVRVAPGLAPSPGAVGDFFWGGVAGTAFVISPAEEMFAVMMVQAAEHREHFRNLFRNLLGAALL